MNDPRRSPRSRQSRKQEAPAWASLATSVLCLVLLAIAFITAPSPPARSPGAHAAPPPRHIVTTRCDLPESMTDAARANARSLRDLEWRPFRIAETGWEIYAPLMAATLNTTCAPTSPGFAAALARWQSGHGASPTGIFDEPDFHSMHQVWRAKRNVRRTPGSCPAPPHEGSLAVAAPAESYGGKLIQLRPRALQAYRDMIAAARAEVPELRSDPRLLTIFSAFRSPAYDAARCLRDGNCDGVRRAVSCSPHRTGLVMDVFLGSAPGYGPDSTANANRLYQTRTPAYRWLVRNAGRFGFANYPFEPWHWEWTGEAP